MPGSLSILVVDDEEELATFFQEAIEAMGLDVVSFTDPLQAFGYFKDNLNNIQLIITDLRMPGISGLELAKKVRELNHSVKIFLMTAFNTRDLENNSDYVSARIDKLIQKPVRFSELRLMINSALQNRC
jgi:DNA-binding response OmpR family regulator